MRSLDAAQAGALDPAHRLQPGGDVGHAAQWRDHFLAIFTGDPENVADLAKQVPNIHVVTTTDLGFQYIAFNLRRPPFDDTAFRVALSTAISRKVMAAAA